MQAVDFITQSIRFKANPNRTAIINRLRALLSAPLANKNMEKRQQQSLYGDRMECFLLLATQDRETAKNVISRLRKNPENAFYQFAVAVYQKQKV